MFIWFLQSHPGESYTDQTDSINNTILYIEKVVVVVVGRESGISRFPQVMQTLDVTILNCITLNE